MDAMSVDEAIAVVTPPISIQLCAKMFSTQVNVMKEIAYTYDCGSQFQDRLKLYYNYSYTVSDAILSE